MPYALYEASIVPAKNSLESLTTILKKAEASEKAAEFPQTRLHPDMLPLAFQIHMITNVSFHFLKRLLHHTDQLTLIPPQLCQQAAARLTGAEPAAYENNLASFADFHARIAEVSALVAKADKKTVDAMDGKDVTIGFGPGKSVTLSAEGYVNGWVVPNLFFHVTTAYNIFRKEGVDLGKMDFLKPYVAGYVDLAAAGLA